MELSIQQIVSNFCTPFSHISSLNVLALFSYSFVVLTVFSTSAAVLCGIAVIFLAWAIWRAVLQRLLVIRRQKHWAEAAHYLRQRELFTIVSQQLHKPFSKMLEALTDVLTGEFLSDKVLTQLSEIRHSGLRLMTTVHDLQEASTVLKEGTKLRAEEGNLAQIVESVCSTFEEWANQKKVSIEKQLFGSVTRVCFDPIKVEMMLENMLSNACRTVPQGGQLLVRITVEEMEAKIEIFNSTNNSRFDSLAGRLKRLIFQQEFEKSEMRDQLDLCIVKLAAAAHNGFALCSHGADNKRRLAVHLPVESRDHWEAQPEMSVECTVAAEGENPQKYRYHDDKSKQISVAWITNLPEQRVPKSLYLRNFEIVVNSNRGLDSAEIARLLPDIIILYVDPQPREVMDWLMALKQDREVAQIPTIILCDSLNATTAHELYIAGADACIQGVIQPNLLEQRINSIVAQRESLKNIYSKRFVIKTIHSPAGNFTSDEHFLNSLVRIIEKRLSESGLGVGALMQEMGMSHSVLYRRVNAITGKGVTDFIKFVRLNKAMDMLKEGKMSVADISISTGFSSARYFSTCFKSEFGVRPTDVSNGVSRKAV